MKKPLIRNWCTAMRRILRFSSALALIALATAALVSCSSREKENLLHTTFKGLNAERHCVLWQGASRCYYLVQPSDGKPATHLLVALHPAFHDVAAMEDLSGLVRPLAQTSIATLYPEGIHKQWNDGRHAEESKTFRAGTDDVGFLSLMISDTQSRLNLDTGRTTLAGMSNGGMMALRMACETRLAKGLFAVVANLPVGLEQQCRTTLHHATLVFGTEDDVVPYQGGHLGRTPTAWGSVISAEKTERLLAYHMGCKSGYASYQLDALDDGAVVHKHDYRCGSRTLETYHVQGMGHTWPNEDNVVQAFLTTRGRITREIDANELLISAVLGR